MRLRSERGATAVEFAIIMVPLLLMLVGILEFGRAYSAQVSISAAAREGARVMALQNSSSAAKSATKAAAPVLSPALTDAQIVITPATCTAGASVTVTITYPLNSVSGLFSSFLNGKNLQGVGVMRCGA